MKRTKSSDTHSQKRQRKRTPNTNHAHGANGRPVVLANVRYSVDIVALKEYAATDEAGRTKASSNQNDVKSGFTERQLIELFLKHVVSSASGDGICTVSYTRSEIGQALVDAGFIDGA